MPLVYNTANPPRKLYVLFKISTNQVLGRRLVYPASVDDAPIIGLDPDLIYLAMDTDPTPDYDSRVYNLVTHEARVDNLWRTTYSTPKRAPEQIKVAIQNRETIETAKHVTEYEREKLEILALAILFAINSGATLTTRQTAIKNKVLAAAAKLLQNDQRAADLFTEVDNDNVPDIDSGWASTQ